MRPALGAVLLVLLSAAAPAAAEQPLEPLASQLRLTHVGPDGDPTLDAGDPAVAYNSRRDEYFVVWAGNDALSPEETDIYGLRVAADGKPVGEVVRITSATTPVGDSAVVAREPAVAYDLVRDQYAVAYTANDGGLPISANRVYANIVNGDGRLTGDAIRVSARDPSIGRAASPDLVFNPADDRFLVVWSERPAADAGQPQILGALVNIVRRQPESEPIPYSAGRLEDATHPTVTLRATQAAYAVAWLQDVDGELEVFGRLVERNGDVAESQPPQAITAAGSADEDGDASAPDLAANPQLRELVLAYAGANASEGDEIHVQRLTDELRPAGAPARVSAAGYPDSRQAYRAREPAITWHPDRSAYLVTWQANDDARPGMSDAEFEMFGQILNGTAQEVGTDDFLISRMGLDGTALSAPAQRPAAAAVNSRSGEWFVVWAADHAVPPLADEEYELWGRRIGPNFDRDYDGSPVPADCDDLNPARRPGLKDMADNGIDEDCSGKDNLDGDGDGAARPRDCNDRNPFVRPGHRDVPGNGIDEDCSGRDTPVPLAAKVRVTWLFGGQTTVGRMLVERVPKGARATVRCSGRGCPSRLAGRGHSVRVRRKGRLTLTRLFAGVRLSPGARVEVRITHRDMIGLLERYRIRAGGPPSQQTRCLPPGSRRPSRCPA